MTVVVDPVAALRSILLADATVTALVGAEGIVDEIDETIAPSMPKPIVVLKPSGGPRSPGGGYQRYGATRIDVICYGETLYESWLVYLAVSTLLKQLQRQVVDGVLVHGVSPQAKGATGREPVKQWPVTYSSWLVYASEIPAA